jgi:HlyD family secretion protein
VNNDQLKLMPGLTANVKILIASVQNVMKVSNMALRFQPPNDIIDTTGGAGLMRGEFTGRGKDTGDSSKLQSDGKSIQNGGQFSQEDRARFRAIRDSVQTAHGGKLSQEELRSEMQKLFAGRMNQNNPPVQQNKPKANVKKGSNAFGVTSNFPEYQKNAYVPSHQSGRGKVWVLKSNGLLESVSVRTGLNDGRFTEITTVKLKPGDQVVLGATSNNDSGTEQVKSPLSGSTQQQPRGGGFR